MFHQQIVHFRNTKHTLHFWHCMETDFCLSLLNKGVHLYVAVKHKAICASHPKSFRSISLSNLFFTKPRRGRGERGDRQSPKCWGHWTGWPMVRPVRVRKYHVSLQLPHSRCTVGLCNGGGLGVTICQEVYADSRGLYSSHYQHLDILLLVIIQVHRARSCTLLHTCLFYSERSVEIGQGSRVWQQTAICSQYEEQHLGFLCFAFPFLLHIVGIMEVFMFKARTPPSILQLPLSPFCLVEVCGYYEGCSCCRSTKPDPCVEMQPPGWAALSLPTSPAGSWGSSWLVALCLQTDGNGQRRGEVKREWGRGGVAWMEKGEGGQKESVCSH